MKYLRTVPLLKDESLSSWLIRSSLYQGCDTLTFTSKIWGKYRVWTVDFERQMNTDRLQALSKITGITYEQLNETLLVHTAKQYSDSFNAENSIWLWVISQGIRNRKKSVGQPFCPQCFVENTPYLRREWRMAWATCCNRHTILLQDHCPVCGFLYSPSKLSGFEKTMAHCHHCGHDMCTNATEHAVSLVQQTMSTDSADWLLLLRGFIACIRKAIPRPDSNIAGMLRDLGLATLPAPSQTAGSFEWLPIAERHALLQAACPLMNKTLAEVVQAAQNNNVSANTLYHATERHQIAFFEQVRAQLHERSYRRIRSATGRKQLLSEDAVLKKWARLERKIQRASAS